MVWVSLYWPLKHADWHGLTPTDLIFPFFIFIVGMSITLSVNAMLTKGVTKQSILRSGVVRTVKLVALGWFLALFYYNFRDPNFSWLDERLAGIRIMGVLQRIGLVYLIALACYIYIKPKYIALTFVSLLIGYGALMIYTPYSLPNGEIVKGLWLHGNNLSAWLDNLLLGANHVYYATAKPLAFDPEGILSTLPAIATALSGILCRYYISTEKKPWQTSQNIYPSGYYKHCLRVLTFTFNTNKQSTMDTKLCNNQLRTSDVMLCTV